MSDEIETPAICDSCLGTNPYIQMTRESNGLQCKTCTRPFTVFRWRSETRGKASFKKTSICGTCARARNCCSCCMLDLTLGIDLNTRDAMMKLAEKRKKEKQKEDIVQDKDYGRLIGAKNEISKIYYADLLEKKLRNQSDEDLSREMDSKNEAAKGMLEAISSTSDTANTERKQKKRKFDNEGTHNSDGKDSKVSAQEILKLCKNLPFNGSLIPSEASSGKGVKSFFIFGIPDSLPDYKIKSFFSNLGQTPESIYVNHKSMFGYVNFINSQTCQVLGDQLYKAHLERVQTNNYDSPVLIIIDNHPLRVCYGKPVSLDFNNLQEFKLSKIVQLKLAKLANKDRELKQKDNNKDKDNDNLEFKNNKKAKKDGSKGLNSSVSSLPLPGTTNKSNYKSLKNLEL